VKHADTHEASVTLEEGDGSLHIQVADHGVGFDVLALESQKISASNRGFGLFSIRERMLSLGGRFELNSSPGHGTTATLVLPLGERTAANVQVLSFAKAPESADTPKLRILVADNHAMVRQGLCSILNQYKDIQVVGEAANGEEAVALATSIQPDVILMDVTMPKLDGIEATRLLKRKHPGVDVIGLSIHTTASVEAAMRDAGAIAFINKEAAADVLYHTIQTVRKTVGSLPLQ